MIGFISLVLGLLGMALMRTRFPPERNVKLVLDVQGFRDVRFSLTAVAMFAIDFAVLIPPSYLTTYALANGVDSSLSYQPIPDTAQILGRSLPGFVVDRWGRFNTNLWFNVSDFNCDFLPGTRGGSCVESHSKSSEICSDFS